jgi:hypothetical protein
MYHILNLRGDKSASPVEWRNSLSPSTSLQNPTLKHSLRLCLGVWKGGEVRKKEKTFTLFHLRVLLQRMGKKMVMINIFQFLKYYNNIEKI